MDFEKLFNDELPAINEKIESIESMEEFYLYFYEKSKFFGPDYMFDEFEEIIIAIWGSFTTYANHIGYEG